jgi:hypothetical protein
MNTETTDIPVRRGVKGGSARMKNLSSVERKELAGKAASARWGKKGKKKPKKSAPLQPKVFGIALATAERECAKAIEDLVYHENMVAVLGARIPTLLHTITALKNQRNPLPVTQAQMRPVTSASYAALAPYDVPPQPGLPPVPRANRAQGGAMGVVMEGEPENENQFLEETPATGGGGAWHG